MFPLEHSQALASGIPGARGSLSTSPTGTSFPSSSIKRVSVNIKGLPMEPGLATDSSTVMEKQFTPTSVRP